MSKNSNLTVRKIKTESKEVQNPLEAFKHLCLAMKKDSVCSECNRETKIIFTALQRNLSDLKQINVCQDCLSFNHLEKFLGKEQAEKMREEWKAKLKRFDLSPLSVAKYFYENWKTTDPVIMQRMIYFAYLEILREEDIILFEEKFQAWPGGPVLKSVIYPMYENHSKLKSFFSKIISIDNPLVLNYLEKIARKYSELKSCQIYREARNKLWEKTRRDLNDEKENQPISEASLFAFIQASKNQLLSSHQ